MAVAEFFAAWLSGAVGGAVCSLLWLWRQERKSAAQRKRNEVKCIYCGEVRDGSRCGVYCSKCGQADYTLWPPEHVMCRCEELEVEIDDESSRSPIPDFSQSDKVC